MSRKIEQVVTPHVDETCSTTRLLDSHIALNGFAKNTICFWFGHEAEDAALSPLTIAAMYKSRRQVELFFKRTTRHLRIKRFLGPGENAVIIRPNVLRQPWMTAEDRLIEIAGQGGNGPWNARIAPKVIDPAHLVQYGCDQTVGFPQQDQQICMRTNGYKHAMKQEISVWPL